MNWEFNKAIGMSYFVVHPHPDSQGKGRFKTDDINVFRMVKSLSGMLKIRDNTIRLIPKKFPRKNQP